MVKGKEGCSWVTAQSMLGDYIDGVSRGYRAYAHRHPIPTHPIQHKVQPRGCLTPQTKNGYNTMNSEITSKEFTCLSCGKRFVRTGESRLPEYEEYYEIYPGACITSQATRKYREGSKFMIVQPRFMDDPGL